MLPRLDDLPAPPELEGRARLIAAHSDASLEFHKVVKVEAPGRVAAGAIASSCRPQATLSRLLAVSSVGLVEKFN